MATNTTFTVGRDCSSVLTTPYGTNITLPLGTQITWKREYTTAKSTPLNTPTVERPLPMGHRLTFAYDRTDASIDRVFSQIEANWWAGGTPDGGTNASGAAFIYVNEASGGQTTYNFQNAAISQTDGGTFSVENPVKGEIAVFAPTMVMS
jgi:hypothetical protein